MRATYQRDSGARSRQQRAIQKGLERNASRSERNKYLIEVNKKIVRKVAEKKPQFSQDDLPIYGIYKKNNKWMITAMAFYRTWNSSTTRYRRATATMKEGDYCVILEHEHSLSDGIKLFEKDTKKKAMKKIKADSSEKITAGAYLVKRKHDPTFTSKEVPQDEYRKARKKAYCYSI